MKKLKLLRWLIHLSISQRLVLAISIIVSVIFISLGFNVNKLDDLCAELDVSSLNLMRLDSVNVIVTNPSLIPFAIQPFSLSLKTKADYPIARMHCSQATRVNGLSTAIITLHIQLEKGVKLPEILRLLTKRVIVEGVITAEIFRFHRSLEIRKEYALSPMQQTH